MPRQETIKFFISLVIGAALLSGGWYLVGQSQAEAADMVVYKSPWCGCCNAWVKHIRREGISVEVVEREDMDPTKRKFDVPQQLESCHTARINGYTIEGHVPAREIKRLLSERPQAVGLSVPGMPNGSPGMDQGGAADRFQVILWSSKGRRAYANY